MTARGGIWFSYMEKVCYKSSCQNTTWSNCFRNIIKVSNSLDPNSFGPNCLQMLSVEKSLARVKRSCQKFLGYLKKKSAHMILSAPLPWLFKLCKSIKNGHQGHLHVYSSVCLRVSNCNCYWSNLIQSWFIWHILSFTFCYWERADLLALVCGVYCEFVTFPLVSWVRCGT